MRTVVVEFGALDVRAREPGATGNAGQSGATIEGGTGNPFWVATALLEMAQELVDGGTDGAVLSRGHGFGHPVEILVEIDGESHV